jgi:hypothetical protein
VFPNQTLRLLGAILSEDAEDFAPIADTTTESAPTTRFSHFATLTLPGGSGRVVDDRHVPIDPELPVAILEDVATFATSALSRDTHAPFAAYLQLRIDPTGVVTVPSSVPTVWFTDPWTLATYRALHFGAAVGEPGALVGASALVHPTTGAPANEAGIAARMLLHAQDLDFARTQATARGDATTAAQIESRERAYLTVLATLHWLTLPP